MKVDRRITDCRLATMVPGGEPYGAIDDGAILILGTSYASVQQAFIYFQF